MRTCSAFGLFLAWVVFLVGGGCATSPPLAEHVVLISIDGLRPEFYLPDSDGRFEAPNLRKLRQRGAHARAVVGVFPTITYPNHASMVTGVRPSRHGIGSNTVLSSKGAGPGWIWRADRFRHWPLWYRARQEGLSIGMASWPTSVGAQRDAMWVLPERWAVPGEPHTAVLLQSLSTPDVLVTVLPRDLKPLRAEKVKERAQDRLATATAVRILKRWEPGLLLVHLVEVDAAQHAYGRDHPEVSIALGRVDYQIGRILRTIEEIGIADRTAVVITGDHGFEDVETMLSPNVLFAGAGWIESGKANEIESWTVYAHVDAAQAAIHAPPGQVEAVRELLQANRVVDGREAFDILSRNRLRSLGAHPTAALGIVARPGFSFDRRFTGDFARTLQTIRGTHGGFPERSELKTGFLAAGAGIRPGVRISSMSLLDVGPTVSALLGFRLGPKLEGRVRAEIFSSGPP